MKTVFDRVQFVRKAPSSVQSVNLASVRLAPVRTAPEKLTLANWALVRLQCEKSALTTEPLCRETHPSGCSLSEEHRPACNP